MNFVFFKRMLRNTKEMTFIHSFICSECFILVRENIPGTMGMKKEYILDGTPVFLSLGKGVHLPKSHYESMTYVHDQDSSTTSLPSIELPSVIWDFLSIICENHITIEKFRSILNLYNISL